MSTRRLHALSAALAFASIQVFAAPCAAAERKAGLTLIWEAPAECPTAQVVRDTVQALIEGEYSAVLVRVDATVTKENGLYRVKVVTFRDGTRGTRHLEAPTCEALAEAVTVIVALLVDPDLFSRQRGEGASPAPGRAAPSKPPDAGAEASGESGMDTETPDAAATADDDGELDVSPPANDVSATEQLDDDDELDDDAGLPYRDRGLQALASLAGSVESGALPGLGFGVTARGGVRRRRFRAEFAVSRWLSRDAASSEPGKGASVTASTFAGWGCFRAVPGHTAPLTGIRLPPDDEPAIEAGACLGAEVGQITARSFGVAGQGEGSSAFAALGGALRLGATAVDWLSLDVRIEALGVLYRPSFNLGGIGPVHRPEPWSLRAAMGAEARFP